MKTSFINSGDNLPDRLPSFVRCKCRNVESSARSDVLGKAQCDVLARRRRRLDLERVQFRNVERVGVEINGGTLFEGMSATTTMKGLSDAYR